MMRQGMQWIAVARRPLSIAEFQEAAIIDPNDTQYEEDKVPDAQKLLQSYHGLVIRTHDDTVRFAHHTVLQYLTSLADTLRTGSNPGPEPPEVALALTLEDAHFLTAQVCATYLQFTEFQRALIQPDEGSKRLNVSSVVSDRGLLGIPRSLGINERLYSVSQKLLGLKAVKTVDFDMRKVLKTSEDEPSGNMLEKYGL